MLYLIGEPGSGKSTLAAALTCRAESYIVRQPFAITVWQTGPDAPIVHELGYTRAAFSGTDALSMSVQPKALRYLELIQPEYVLAEGDRLANGSFFDRVREIGYALSVAFIDIGEEEAARRRKRRAAELGQPEQKEAWVRGRRTKVANLAREYATVRLDASDLAGMVNALADEPVVCALRKDTP